MPKASCVGVVVGHAEAGRVGDLFEELVIFQHALETRTREEVTTAADWMIGCGIKKSELGWEDNSTIRVDDEKT